MVYIILMDNDLLGGKVYPSFDEAKAALTEMAMEKEWRLENDTLDNPVKGFENKFGFDDGEDAEPVDFPIEVNGVAILIAKGETIKGGTAEIKIRKLVLGGGRRRKTVKVLRMKKDEYLREHHHLFRVLRNPTRRALNAELRKQKAELKERGLKG